MLININDYDSILDVVPCIEYYDRYMIMISFVNGDGIAYSFFDKDEFLKSYREILNRIGD